MSTISEACLDAYSRVAVPMILSRFPEWAALAKLSPRSYSAGSTVDFNIPCPSPVAEYGLWVSTADEELSVGFHTYHNHFTNYESRLNLAEIEAGIQHAVDIIEERVGVISWYRGGAYAGSQPVQLPHLDPLPGLFDALGTIGAQLADICSDCDRVTLRSWLGRYDREEFRR